MLEGGSLQLPETGEPDPLLAGALRVSEALEGGATTLVGVWQKAPMQALARLHALAAADLVDDDRLGRPRADADVGPRLELLVEMVTGKSDVPATVLAAVAHGELLTLAPFGTADGLVARGVSRLVTIASGLDPHGLGVPEVFWMRRSGDYRAAARGFASGTPDGLGRVVGAELPSACGPERGRRCRSRKARRSSFQQSESGRRSETGSARRPLARTPVTKRASQVCVGGLGVLTMRYGCNPTQGAVVVVRSSQLRRPATLLPISRL